MECLKGKKILFVVNHAEFFLSHRFPLALAARVNGMHVEVATGNTHGVSVLESYGFKVHLVPLRPGGQNPFTDAILIAQLVRLYNRCLPDIIHHITIKPVMYGSLAARIARVPAVANAMAGLGFLFMAEDAKARMIKTISLKLLRRGMRGRNTVMILQNPDDRREFLSASICSPKQIRIIQGSGVDPEQFSATPEPDTQVVVMPARLLLDKGLEEFVSAAKIIKRGRPNARFVVAGAPDPNNPQSVPAPLLEKWQTEGIVEWWGRRDDMPSVYSQANIVCLPSYREGLPKALIEAASCSRAIVATDVPGCREIVKHGVNGFLVASKDSAQLAVALQKLLDDAATRRSFGAAGRQMVLQGFTLQQVVNQTMSIYEDLLIAK